jgi:C1A family cysteine protease
VEDDGKPKPKGPLVQWPFSKSLPAEVDWRGHGAVSRVKRQGNCGACWAIAVAGALEAASAIQTGNLREVSE